MMKFKVPLLYCSRQVSVEILLEVLMCLVFGCNQLTNYGFSSFSTECSCHFSDRIPIGTTQDVNSGFKPLVFNLQ